MGKYIKAVRCKKCGEIYKSKIPNFCKKCGVEICVDNLIETLLFGENRVDLTENAEIVAVRKNFLKGWEIKKYE